jgi:DNA-binding response OmpR family regulator/GTP-binding protein EngB required for normal cell division
MRPTGQPLYRQQEVNQLLQAVCTSNCAALVGLSNMGKSMVIRAIRDPQVAARYEQETGRRGIFIYLDCNGMLDLSGQGFYELVLRGMQDSIRAANPALAGELQTYYQQIIDPESAFIVPLNFNNAMTAFIENGQQDVILLLDEFDEAFDALDGRVFLNLRALHDRYPHNLLYITATVRRLGFKRGDEQTAEFIELSAAHTFAVRPLPRHDADEVAISFAQEVGIEQPLTSDELDFLWAQAGGHPGLLMACVSKLLEIRSAAYQNPVASFGAFAADMLTRDITVRSECNRLWGHLSTEERETLLSIAVGTYDDRLPRALQSLDEWGLIAQGNGGVNVFCALLADFVRRQATIQRELPSGLWLDEDAGDVFVGGHPIEPLTELEFALLKLLYQRRDKITDKYQIVETVWGVDYIEQVDDARIEKLVSRLRAKIEPDPGNPRYLLTMRGRGYKLAGGE